jgi:hypothetical protein
MPIEWRGSRLRVIARPDGAEITVEAGAPVALAFGDGAWRLVPVGETLVSHST